MSENGSSVALVDREGLEPSPPARLRHVRAMSGLLPGLGVSITPSENGRVNVSLPAEVAELFILDLEKRACEWQDAMGKARVKEAQHQAELRAATGESRRQWEAQEDAWTSEYLRLRDAGKGHREALHIIRGSARRDAQQVTAIEMAVQDGLSRRKHKAREARDAEIRRLAAEGRTTPAISDALRVSCQVVRMVLRRSGIQPQTGDKANGHRKMHLGLAEWHARKEG